NHAHCDADRRLANDIAGRGDVAEVGTPSEKQPVERRTFDDVATHRRIGFNGDADAESGRVWLIGSFAGQVADNVGRDRGDVPALAEIGDADAGCRAIDHVIGDDGAGEREFGVDANLARGPAIVAHDLY